MKDLAPQQQKNLGVFLNRVDLKGVEVEAMIELKMLFGLSPLKMSQELQPPQKEDKKEKK